MMTKKESTKIVKFYSITPGVLVLASGHTVNLQYFFSSRCLTRSWIRQIEYKAITTKEGSAKIVIS